MPHYTIVEELRPKGQRFVERIHKDGMHIPVIAGIWPLVSARNAEFLANEVPGVIVPEPVRSEVSSTTLWATMGVIGFLLRLWTVAGELLLALLATIGDYRAVIKGPPVTGKVPIRSAT